MLMTEVSSWEEILKQVFENMSPRVWLAKDHESCTDILPFGENGNSNVLDTNGREGKVGVDNSVGDTVIATVPRDGRGRSEVRVHSRYSRQKRKR